MINAKHVEISMAEKEIQSSRGFAKGALTVIVSVSALFLLSMLIQGSVVNFEQLQFGAYPEPFGVIASLP